MHRRRIDARVALITGKVSFKGDLSLVTRLGMWLQTAIEQRARRDDDGGMAALRIAPKEQWQADDDARSCAVCRQEFKVSLRALSVEKRRRKTALSKPPFRGSGHVSREVCRCAFGVRG